MKGNYAELTKLSKKRQIIENSTFKGFKNLSQCTKCDLRNECKRPVHPSSGKLNIMIIGQDPGKTEDDQGKGFVGASGKLIWQYLNPKGFNRELFHVTNINKCFPSISKRSNEEQINICSNKWLHNEIIKVKPKIILAFGNSCRYFFEGVNAGIIAKSGTTSWSEKHSTFICWSIHPAATLRSDDNRIHFKNGMKNFVKLLRIFKVKKLI
jgi:DNA polymerase